MLLSAEWQLADDHRQAMLLFLAQRKWLLPFYCLLLPKSETPFTESKLGNTLVYLALPTDPVPVMKPIASISIPVSV